MSRDYITTYSGHLFSPLHPNVDAIDIRDIAHALARIGRANGHFSDFYSVGQHCLDCAREALARGCGARQALLCLLHDASEAYMSDITSPVKKYLRQYIAVEDRLLDLIYNKYVPGGIWPKEQRLLKEIDKTMLYYEFLTLKNERLTEEQPTLYITPCFAFSSFWAVEKQYLDLFYELTEQIQQEEMLSDWKTVGITYAEQQWHAVVLTGKSCSSVSTDTLWNLCSMYEDADAVLIDFPIGLPEKKEEEALRPEVILRRHLSGYGFIAVPCRQAIYADGDVAAREENIRALGHVISPHWLSVRKQLREVDELFQYHVEWKNVLRESSSYVLGESRKLIVQQYQETLFANRVRCHHLEDALCLAVIGQMECRGETKTVPEQPENDAKGLKMQMVVPLKISL